MNYSLKISNFKQLTLVFTILFSVALISFPSINLPEKLLKNEVFTDLKSDLNNEDFETENEIDEYFNELPFSNSLESSIISFVSQESKSYEILFLDIEYPPPEKSWKTNK